MPIGTTTGPGGVYYGRRQDLIAAGLSNTEIDTYETVLEAAGTLYTENAVDDTPPTVGVVTLTDDPGTAMGLAWDDVADVTGYQVWGRPATEEGTYTLLDTVLQGVGVYDDTSANEGVENWYKVRAYTTLEAGDTDLTVYGAYSAAVGETHAAA
jgi:hypothetical protein